MSVVERMLDPSAGSGQGLHKKLPEAKGTSKTAMERQIAATDKSIDALVGELSGPTDKEIAIVEGSTVREPLIPKHGGYRSLKSFQMSEIAYDATVAFCHRFVEKRSRTHDQMVQTARSRRLNIAEGSQASGTSKKTELKLVGVARASLEELLLDCQDFLRQRGLKLRPKDDPRARSVRALAQGSDRTYETIGHMSKQPSRRQPRTPSSIWSTRPTTCLTSSSASWNPGSWSKADSPSGCTGSGRSADAWIHEGRRAGEVESRGRTIAISGRG